MLDGLLIVGIFVLYVSIGAVVAGLFERYDEYGGWGEIAIAVAILWPLFGLIGILTGIYVIARGK